MPILTMMPGQSARTATRRSFRDGAREFAAASGYGGGGHFLVPKSQRQAPRAAKRAPQALRLTPSELSAAVRVASQGSNAKDLQMWKEYSEAVLFHAGSLSPKHIAFITNGFARADVPDRNVFRRLADRALEQIVEFEPRDTALLLNAYAKLAFKDLVLFQQFSKYICTSEAKDLGFGEQQLALVANAYARLELADQRLFETLSVWLGRRSEELTAQGVATVANAYAKIRMRDLKLFDMLASAAERHMPEFLPQHIANLLDAHAKLGIKDSFIIEQLVARVPAHAQAFHPVEVATVIGALTKLDVGNRRALNAVASVLRTRGDEFRARQLAASLHAFSSLTTAYGSVFEDAVPRVLACSPDADAQGLTLLFCAYARAGQPDSQVLRTLLERLEPLATILEPQALVNLFYACGRFALHKEPFTLLLAELLLPLCRTMAPQHVANCLFAAARLGVAAEEHGKLVAALQARLSRGRLQLEPQQCANTLHALAALPVAVSSKAVAAIVERVLAPETEAEWSARPQLVASVCISCASLGETPAPLFGFASRVVRNAENRPGQSGGGVRLSKQCVADLLAAFSAAGFFDLDLFGWSLSQLSAGDAGATIPMGAKLRGVAALDYADHIFQASPQSSFTQQHDSSKEMDASSLAGDSGMSMLFFDCPDSFRAQVHGFYEGVAYEVLRRSNELPGTLLDQVAVPFARAGLLSSAIPFDLLSHAARTRAEAAAAKEPRPLFEGHRVFDVTEAELGQTSASALSEMGISSPSIHERSSNSLAIGGADGDTILDRLLRELEQVSADVAPQDQAFAHDSGQHTGSIVPDLSARRLAKYAALAKGRAAGDTGEDTSPEVAPVATIPAQVLDPILGRLTTHVEVSAGQLSFENVAVAVAALAGAGVWPRAAVDALVHAAERTFPAPPSCGDAGTMDIEGVALAAGSVAQFFNGLSVVGRDAGPRLRRQLLGFCNGLADAATKQPEASRHAGAALVGDVADASPLGRRPLRTVASLMGELRQSMEGGPTVVAATNDAPADVKVWQADAMRASAALLVASLRLHLLPQLVPIADPRSSVAASSEAVLDLAGMLTELLARSENLNSFDDASNVSLRSDACSVVSQLLAQHMHGWTPPTDPPLPIGGMVDLMQGFAQVQPQTLGFHYLPLLVRITEHLVHGAQSLGPSGIAASLHAFARMRVFSAVRSAELAGPRAIAQARQDLEGKLRTLCNLPSCPHADDDDLRRSHGESVHEQMPRLLISLMRSLLVWTRRLTPRDAAYSASFCSMALDAPMFSESERAEARAGLAQLLERLCWERRRWTVEDRRIVTGIGALLRSEYPELLRDGAWVSRSVLTTLEELRGSREGFSAL